MFGIVKSLGEDPSFLDTILEAERKQNELDFSVFYKGKKFKDRFAFMNSPEGKGFREECMTSDAALDSAYKGAKDLKRREGAVEAYLASMGLKSPQATSLLNTTSYKGMHDIIASNDPTITDETKLVYLKANHALMKLLGLWAKFSDLSNWMKSFRMGGIHMSIGTTLAYVALQVIERNVGLTPGEDTERSILRMCIFAGSALGLVLLFKKRK